MASQLINLLSVFDFDELPTEATTLGSKATAALDCYGRKVTTGLGCEWNLLSELGS